MNEQERLIELKKAYAAAVASGASAEAQRIANELSGGSLVEVAVEPPPAEERAVSRPRKKKGQ